MKIRTQTGTAFRTVISALALRIPTMESNGYSSGFWSLRARYRMYFCMATISAWPTLKSSFFALPISSACVVHANMAWHVSYEFDWKPRVCNWQFCRCMPDRDHAATGCHAKSRTTPVLLDLALVIPLCRLDTFVNWRSTLVLIKLKWMIRLSDWADAAIKDLSSSGSAILKIRYYQFCINFISWLISYMR